MSKKQKTSCVKMTGPDDQMDHYGDKRRDANPLPVKCPRCTFPDINFVAKPYLLDRGISSPAETSNARMGNFLVRERVRRILDLAVPSACSFHPTADHKTGKPTNWSLAAPSRTLNIPLHAAKPPFCSKCGEPKVRGAPAMRPVWTKMTRFDSGGVDVFKSQWTTYFHKTVEDEFAETNCFRKKAGLELLQWPFWGIEAPPHSERWTRNGMDRELYFSTRLDLLLLRTHVRGQLVRSLSFSEVKPTAEDEAWIEKKLTLLASKGLVEQPKVAASKSSGLWFRRFLERNAAKNQIATDFAAVEKKHKIALPQSYKDFVTKVGAMSFADVNTTEGFTANILLPKQLNFKDYRRGRVSDLDEEQSKIDGVLFADTDHGDGFVFDVSTKTRDYPVYWHDHEQNTLEPFAANFAECVKRFAQKN